MDVEAHKEAMAMAAKFLTKAKANADGGTAAAQHAANFATISMAASMYAMALMSEQDWD